jgi:hypothetical protein
MQEEVTKKYPSSSSHLMLIGVRMRQRKGQLVKEKNKKQLGADTNLIFCFIHVSLCLM